MSPSQSNKPPEETRAERPAGQLSTHAGPNKMYIEFASVLRRQVKGMSDGDRLPPIHVLAAEQGISIATVRSAISLLEQEGLIRRQQGRGTFVLPPEGASAVPQLSLVADWGAVQAYWPTSKPLIIEEQEGVCCRLIPSGRIAATSYHRLRRVHFSGNTPTTSVEIFIASDWFARAPSRFRSEIALHVLCEIGRDAELAGFETLTVGSADITAAEDLRIPLNSPVVNVARWVSERDGRIVYAGFPIYRGDMMRLERTFGPTRLTGT